MEGLCKGFPHNNATIAAISALTGIMIRVMRPWVVKATKKVKLTA